ncbi:MAG: hypothetical protein K6F95_07600 [Selenomonas sp.]|uniref:hypothetical protein n=1 Tax=Selenomonas sp. TaxID=2053611 RepID=UPI0025EC7C74|nr:hypothetical protein [Selenomonas sp.]MCR5757756.1 hypothetical protein [Selenomonas sp.]
MAIKLTAKAEKLYASIRAKGGGTLSEWWLRDKTGLSHGSICAARRELVAAGLIRLGKDVRKTTYQLPPFPEQVGQKSAGKAKRDKPLQEEAFMPHVCGDFGDFDDWLLSLNDMLGDCVDVRPASKEQDTYWVFAPQYGEEDSYLVRENDAGGITVE